MTAVLWGYCDPDPKRAPHQKLANALIHYRKSRGGEAVVAFVSASVVELIPSPPIVIVGRVHIPPHTFFLQGAEDE